MMYDLFGALGGNLQMSPPAWRVPPLAAEILLLVDGVRSTGAILDLLEASPSILPSIDVRDGKGRRQAIKVSAIGALASRQRVKIARQDGAQEAGIDGSNTPHHFGRPSNYFPGTSGETPTRAHVHVETRAGLRKVHEDTA